MSAFNGSGTFVISGTGLPYVTGTTISSTVANQLNTDLATGLTTCVTKDGQTTPTANLPMGSFKHTTVGDATSRNQYASLGQVQDRTGAYAVAGGTVDVITATFSPAYTALTDGMQITVKAAGANTVTAPTLAINGLTATTITKLGGKALQAGDIIGAGHELVLVYSSTGTRWELVNPSPSSPTFVGTRITSTQAVTTVTTTKVQLNSSRIDNASYWDGVNFYYKPLVAGTYMVSGSVYASGTVITSVVVSVSKNGTSGSGGTEVTEVNVAGGGNSSVSAATPVSFISMNGTTDTLELDVTVTGTGTLVVNFVRATTQMSIKWVGP